MSLARIVESFARSAADYDAHAHVQLQCAERLAGYMQANSRHLIEGPLLEIGCGTGIFSRRLCDIFTDRQLILTDACAEMIAHCRARLAAVESGRLQFKRAAIGEIAPREQYALIVSAFVLQWLEDFEGGLSALTAALKPGGRLFFSLPETSSFAEWKAICRHAAVPYTGNPLPSCEAVRQFAAANQLHTSMCQETFTAHYRSFEEFLNNLKLVGASTTLCSQPLTISEMRRLLSTARRLYPNSFTATYRVLFGYLEKPQ